MRDAQPRLQGLISTVLVDSPHSDHSLAVHTVTALAKHARFLAASPVVLAFDGATVVPARPSVGIDEFGMHFGSACAKSDANETHYASYKQHIMEHARRVLAMPVLVEASERRCIAGVIRLALETTYTEYVLVMQYDQPFVRDIDAEALLRLMSRNVDTVKAVWLDTGVNQCTAANAWTACGRNRPWFNPRSPPISLGTMRGTNASTHEETLYPVQQWTDGVHVSRRDFYIDHVFPPCCAGWRRSAAWAESRTRRCGASRRSFMALAASSSDTRSLGWVGLLSGTRCVSLGTTTRFGARGCWAGPSQATGPSTGRRRPTATQPATTRRSAPAKARYCGSGTTRARSGRSCIASVTHVVTVYE